MNLFKKIAALLATSSMLATPVLNNISVLAEETATWKESLLDPANPTTVRFYNYTIALPGAGEGIQNLVDDFNNGIGKEKGVVIEVVEDDTKGTVSQADVQAGLQVDVLQQTYSSAAGAIESKGLVPMNQVVPQEEIDNHLGTLYDNVQKLGIWNNEFYSIPWTISTPMLYLNVDLLEEAGIDWEGGPANWQEMYDWAKQVTDNTEAVGLAFSPIGRWVHDAILYSNGAQTLNEDGTEVAFTSPEGMEALGIWKQFYTDKVALGGADADTVEAFMAGNAAMHLQSTSVYNAISGAFNENGWNLDGYPMPGFGDKEAVPTHSGAGLFIRPTEDDKQAQANWEVVKYMTGPEAYTIITTKIGYLPLIPNLETESEELAQFVESNPMIARNIEQIGNIAPQTKWPAASAPEAFNAFLDFLDYGLTTDIDLQQAADQVAQQINSLLAQ